MRLPRPVLSIVSGTLLACGVLAAPPEEPQIYECPDGHGNVLYQDEPCREAPVDGAAGTGPAAASEPGARPAPPAAERRAVETARRDRPPRTSPSPPRTTSGPYGSPERTWQAFVAAIGSGDGAAAAACLTPRALAALGADAAPLPVAELRQALGAFTRIRVDGEVGPFWSVHALRANRPPKWIFFERTARGEWKIAAI